MTPTDLVDAITGVVERTAGHTEPLDVSLNFRDDLFFDSLSFLELMLVVEDVVGHEISFEFVSTWTTVGDLLDWLEATR